jgi:hypothetical protein
MISIKINYLKLKTNHLMLGVRCHQLNDEGCRYHRGITLVLQGYHRVSLDIKSCMHIDG